MAAQKNLGLAIMNRRELIVIISRDILSALIELLKVAPVSKQTRITLLRGNGLLRLAAAYDGIIYDDRYVRLQSI
jgi:hypothetical protein